MFPALWAQTRKGRNFSYAHISPNTLDKKQHVNPARQTLSLNFMSWLNRLQRLIPQDSFSRGHLPFSSNHQGNSRQRLSPSGQDTQFLIGIESLLYQTSPKFLFENRVIQTLSETVMYVLHSGSKGRRCIDQHVQQLQRLYCAGASESTIYKQNHKHSLKCTESGNEDLRAVSTTTCSEPRRINPHTSSNSHPRTNQYLMAKLYHPGHA